jgi:sugar-specific transcriptional regulator TrmB
MTQGLSDYPEREIGVVIECLKHHPALTADEIADTKGIDRIEVFHCLKVLTERNIAAEIQGNPTR